MDSKLLLVFGLMALVVIVVIVFVVIVLKKIKETDPSNIDTSLKTNTDTTQSFLPFESVRDSMIHLGNHQYRAIIKCSSINYALKTEKEHDIVELSYQRFLNSLSHPISIYVQTRTMDNSKMLESLRTDILDTIDVFPVLKTYGEEYFDEMIRIYDTIGNNKEKKKYIIVPFNDAALLTEASDEEKYQAALEEMQNRCLIIMDGLQNIGISTTLLRTPEIVDLLYASYHKDNANQASEIAGDKFLSLVVDGENKMEGLPDAARLDWILYEAQKRLEVELASNKATSLETKERAEIGIQKINQLRSEIAGYYNLKTAQNFEQVSFVNQEV